MHAILLTLGLAGALYIGPHIPRDVTVLGRTLCNAKTTPIPHNINELGRNTDHLTTPGQLPGPGGNGLSYQGRAVYTFETAQDRGGG